MGNLMERTWAKRTDDLIEKALIEDLGDGDITTEAIVSPDIHSTAFLFSKSDGILAGIDVAMKVFHKVDPSLDTSVLFKDGEFISHGQKVAEISGSVSSILKAERTSLNFLGRMTGIASKTSLLIKSIKGCHAKILDTRKTMPTMRHLDKYAFRVGGGSNHRFGLNDMILIKDNHIAVAGSIRIAVERAVSLVKKKKMAVKIEVECKSHDDVLEAVYTPVDIIMLDNMDIAEIQKSINSIRTISSENGTKIRIEASGNINGNNIRKIANTGVDYISMGAVTHSVESHDFSLLFAEL